MPMTVKTYRLDVDDIRAIIDREASRLEMTGEQFIRAYFDGTLSHDHPAAIELSMLMKLSEDAIRRTVSSSLR